MKQILKNDLLTLEVDSFGAELQSIRGNRNRTEYLWQGDKAFWGRRSPVLFPIVGRVWDGVFRMDGKEYRLGQHGFARDREFEPMEDAPEDEAWFVLRSDASTLELYPRQFRLEIGYRLDGERITVMWRIINEDSRPMAFHIGAHPAFNYPAFSAADPVHGYFLFGRDGLLSQVIEEKGCVGDTVTEVETDKEMMLPLTGETFLHDALILADSQVRRVSMLDKERNPWLTLIFNAPLVGLWSPKPDAPFVCIEPWWGRCDRMGFHGDFSEREYTNVIAPGETFEASYMIVIDNL